MTLTLWAISYTVVGLLVAGCEAVRAGWDDDRARLWLAPILGVAWLPYLLATVMVRANEAVARIWAPEALYRLGQRLRERQS